jgi:spore coat protein U-like protein
MSARIQSFAARRRLTFTVAALSCFAFADRSHATSTATLTFPVQVTVNSSCIINSASTMDFGAVGVFTVNQDSTSTIAVQCTNSTPYDIGLNEGTGSGATVAVRKMTSGSNTINYSLYTDTTRTAVWGNSIGSNTQHAVGNGAAQNYTVFGRVPVQAMPAPGAYTDTITVTVTY